MLGGLAKFSLPDIQPKLQSAHRFGQVLFQGADVEDHTCLHVGGQATCGHSQSGHNYNYIPPVVYASVKYVVYISTHHGASAALPKIIRT